MLATATGKVQFVKATLPPSVPPWRPGLGPTYVQEPCAQEPSVQEPYVQEPYVQESYVQKPYVQ